MSVDREQLKAFLLKSGKNRRLIGPAMKTMEPFFLQVESGVWDLKASAELSEKDLARAITLATGRKVKKIDFVSRERRWPYPIVEQEGFYEDDLYNRLFKGIGRRRWEKLWENLESHLILDLRKKYRVNLFKLNRDLMSYLYGCTRFQLILEDGLFYFLAFRLAGDREMVKRFTPLIKLLPHAIPLGEKEDEPGTWLVLAA